MSRAIGAGIAFARKANARAVFDAGRREVLQQIYDEALKEDKKGRRR